MKQVYFNGNDGRDGNTVYLKLTKLQQFDLKECLSLCVFLPKSKSFEYIGLGLMFPSSVSVLQNVNLSFNVKTTCLGSEKDCNLCYVPDITTQVNLSNLEVNIYFWFHTDSTVDFLPGSWVFV